MNRVALNEDTCVHCGRYIPEGFECYECSKKLGENSFKVKRKVSLKDKVIKFIRKLFL